MSNRRGWYLALCFSAPKLKFIASVASNQHVYRSTASSSSYTLPLIYLATQTLSSYNLAIINTTVSPLITSNGTLTPFLSSPRSFVIVNPTSTLLPPSTAQPPIPPNFPKLSRFILLRALLLLCNAHIHSTWRIMDRNKHGLFLLLPCPGWL